MANMHDAAWALQPDALEMLLDEESLQQVDPCSLHNRATPSANRNTSAGDVRPISDECAVAGKTSFVGC